VLAPHLFDQPIGADDFVRVQNEDREHGAAFRAAQLDHLAVMASLQGSEKPEFHCK
jgi:hypothetical protein